MTRHAPTATLAALALALFAPPLLGQAAPGDTAGGITAPVALSPTPVPISTLGLTLYLPEDASVQTDNLPGGQVKALIQPADGTWAIQVYNSRSANLELTAAEALDAAVNLILLQGPRREVRQPRDGRIVRSTPLLTPVDRTSDLRIGAAPGEEGGVLASRAYIVAADYVEGSPRNDGPMGFTILRTSPGNFITIQLDCPYPHYDSSRRVYETIVAAARLDDPDRSSELRRLRLLAGESFLATVSRQDLDALLDDEPAWTRIYEPAPSGSPRDAKEVGFQRTEIRLGQLGEMDPTKRRIDWTTDDREYGYFMRLDAWMLNEPTASAPAGVVPEYFTSQATFFLSRDKQEELWTITVEVPRAGKRERTTLTFIRRGTRLTVRTDAPRAESETAEFAVIPENYLSGIERALLPRLVAQKAGGGGAGLFELGFYTYDPARSSITYRSETFEPAAGSGWLQTTVPFENGLQWTTTLDAQGRLVTQALPPARVIEPMNREAIRALWASKGLVTD